MSDNEFAIDQEDESEIYSTPMTLAPGLGLEAWSPGKFKPQPATIKEDADKMPLCAEKCTLDIIWKISCALDLHCNQSRPAQDAKAAITAATGADYKILLDCLASEYSAEMSSPEFKECLSDIQRSVASASAAWPSVLANEWAKVIDKLKFKLLKLIRCLDLENVFRLIEETDKSAAIIEDQDIVLLLGKTGAGKSTTAHYLAGSVMQKSRTGAIEVQKPASGVEGLDRVKVGQSANSETKFLSPIRLELKSFMRTSRLSSIYFCDSPGFDDTAGAEVDISNTYGMIKAIHKCKSVRPVAVLNYDGMGGRIEGPIELAKLLSRMLPNSDDAILSLEYVFTKFHEDVNPHDLLLAAAERDGLKDTVKQFIEHMIEKTERTCFKIDPLDKEKAVALLKELLKNEPIKYPSEQFKYFLTEHSINALKTQLSLHERAIDCAIKRNDFELICYKLDQLRKLKGCLSGIQSIDTNPKMVTQKLKEHFDKIYAESTSRLQNQIKNKNKLTDDDLKVYVDSVELFSRAGKLINEHLDESSRLDYVKIMEKTLVDISDEVSKQILDFTRDDVEKNLFDNVAILMKRFRKSVQPTFKKMFDELEAEKDRGSQSFKNLREPLIDFKSLASQLAHIKRIETTIASIPKEALPDGLMLAKSSSSSVLDDCKSHVVKYLKDSITKVIDSSQKYDQDFLDKINAGLRNLDEAGLFMSKVIEATEFRAVQSEVVAKLVRLVESLAERIEVLAKGSFEIDSLDKIKPVFEDIKRLRNIADLANQTAEIYRQVTENISECVITFTQSVSQAFDDFAEGKLDVDFASIDLFFRVMKDAEWLNQHIRANLNFNALRNQERKLIRKLYELRDNVLDDDLDVYCYANLEQALTSYSLIQLMKPLGENREDVKKCIEETNSFKLKVKAALSSIEKEVCLDDKSLSHFRSTLAELERHRPADEASNRQMAQINECLAMMKETNSEYYFQKINGRFIESALKYLEVLKANRAKLFRSEAEKTQGALKVFFYQYFRFMDNEFSGTLKTFSDENDGEANLKAKVFRLINHFKDLELLKRQCTETCKSLLAEANVRTDDLIEHFATLLYNYSVVLEDQLQRCITNGDQNQAKYLRNARLMSFLDPYVSGLKEFKTNFAKIYSDHSSKNMSDVKGIIENIDTLLQEEKFTDVASELTKIEDRNVFAASLRQIKHSISASLKNLIDQTVIAERRITSRELASEHIQSLEKMLQSLSKAYREFFIVLGGTNSHSNTNISQVLQAELRDQIERALEATKRNLTNKLLAYLDNLLDWIRHHDFHLVEASLIHYEEVYPVLSDFIQNDSHVTTLQPPPHKSCSAILIERFNLIEKTVIEELDKTEASFKPDARTPIDDYERTRPKHLLDKMEKAARICSQRSKYSERIEKINDMIHANIKNHIEKSTNRKKCLEDIEQILPCLSDKLQSEVNRLLDATKNTLETKEKEIKSKLEAWIAANDVDKMGQFLSSGECPVSMTNEVKSLINNQMIELARGIKKELVQNSESTDKAIRDLILLEKYKRSFGADIIRTDLETIKYTLAKRYESLDLDQLNIARVLAGEEAKKSVHDRIGHFVNIATLLCEAPELITFDHESINGQLATFIQFFEGNFSRFSTALADFNAHVVEETLETSWQSSSVFKMLKGARTNTASLTLDSNFSYVNMVMLLHAQLRDFNSKNQIENIFEDPAELKYEDKRNKMFGHLKTKVSFLQRIEASTHLNSARPFDLSRLSREVQLSLDQKQEELKAKIYEIINKPTVETEENFKILGLNYEILRSFESMRIEKRPEYLPEIDRVLTEQLIAVANEIAGQSKQDVNDTAKKLIYLKKMSNNLPAFKGQIRTLISEKLESLKKTTDFRLADLSTPLKNDEVGDSIVSEFEIFRGEIIRDLNIKTSQHDIRYVLDRLDGDNVNKEMLANRHKSFTDTYGKVIEKYLTASTLDDLVEDIFRLVSEARPPDAAKKAVVWNDKLKGKLPELIAHISAIWTLLNKKYYNEVQDVTKKEYLLKPHPAQVIAIFRLLGIGYANDSTGQSIKITKMQNNLAQVGTGEGKSVVLAITASVLALFDFPVDCACYSEYLSQRDFENFKDIFDLLKLTELITYGTFNEICESIINLKFDIREQVLKLIKTNSDQSTATLKPANVHLNKEKILLVDEVDVFFNKDFYGQLYSPSAKLYDPAISALLDSIWLSRDKKPTFADVESCAEYQEVKAKFSNWIDLISEAIKDTLIDLTTFKSHQYICLDDKIAYKQQDGVAFGVVYGYKTMFAYYHENEQGTISSKSLEENKCFLIRTGCFSYSEIPAYYMSILGVTGTLKTLQEVQLELIKTDFSIELKTYLPSVYGDNKRQFRTETDIVISNKDDYQLALCDEINRRLPGTLNIEVKRAILVFFETKEALYEFYSSDKCKHFKESVNIIEEETTPNDREIFIREATHSGKITFLTRIFGRGIDFICRNQLLLNNGGVHVIQTFLSEEVSEETQIMGRTARQGENGSYSMVLMDEDLEKFFESDYKQAIQAMINENRIYKTLDAARRAYFKKESMGLIMAKESAKKNNDASEQFIKDLESDNIGEVKKFLLDRNRGKLPIEKSRTVCLMDGTGSMRNAINSAKNMVLVMFSRINNILKQQQLPENSFELQFVVYRDYDLRDRLLEHSGWENDPMNLRRFLNSVRALGNKTEHEAIEVGLWHVNEQASLQKISQVILIGDASAKAEAEIKHDRKAFGGEAYWTQTRFGKPTHWTLEADRLRKAGIPIHAFYLKNRCAENFKEIAKATGGKCAFLDVNSDKGAIELTNAVCIQVLQDIGARTNQSNLADGYQRMYCANPNKSH